MVSSGGEQEAAVPLAMLLESPRARGALAWTLASVFGNYLSVGGAARRPTTTHTSRRSAISF
jgi:hypothetical protein